MASQDINPDAQAERLANGLAAFQRGKGVVSKQEFAIQSGVVQGDRVALEVAWSATLAVPFGTRNAGDTMRAAFAVFLDLPWLTEEQKPWITKKLDVFNHWFNHQADRYRNVIAWALDHRSAMVALAPQASAPATTVKPSRRMPAMTGSA